MMIITTLVAKLFSFICLYILSVFVFFNQKRNRVNVWFFILLNTLSGIFMSCFLHSLPSLNVFGSYTHIVWDSLEMFLLSILPFVLLAYINAKTRFHQTKWIMYSSLAVMILLSAQVSLLWAESVIGISRQSLMLLSISVASALSCVVVCRSDISPSVYIKIGLLTMIVSPILGMLDLRFAYAALLLFGIFLFLDLRKFNSKTLHQKGIAGFIFENTNDGIVLTDKERKVIFCNKVAREMLNLTILNSNGELLENVISLVSGDLWTSIRKEVVAVKFNPIGESDEVVATFSEIQRKNKTRGYVLVFNSKREA